MMGHLDVFVAETTIELERDEDGSLWWMQTTVTEGGRRTVEEITWTGEGYRYESTIGDTTRTFTVPASAPVATDAEAFIGSRARAGGLEAGQTFTVPHLDGRARTVRRLELEIQGTETLAAEEGPVECVTMVERDPETGGETRFWIDADGAYVQLRAGATLVRRVPRATAEDLPVRPPVFSITTPASPPLERIFTADRLLVDVHVQGDEHRKLPAFPDSPWSRVVEVEGSDEEGWIVHAELTAHDDPQAQATIPVEPEGFERELEETPLLCCRHPRVVAAAREAVGDTTDAREAARRIAAYAWDRISSGTPDIGELTALEILERGEGDCSEHALLFATLCRAVGIPTRRCSGYVCLGDTWGKHSWCEIWVGAWIGVDPTTQCIGTAARYLFFGYPDLPDSHPGEVSSRAAGRLRFVTTALEEGDEQVDLTDPERFHQFDPETRTGEHRLAGIRLVDVPAGWQVRFQGAAGATLRAEGLDVLIRVFADQGHLRADRMPGLDRTFAGQPARCYAREWGTTRHLRYMVHSRRRWIQISAELTGPEEERAAHLAALEQVLAPTFE
jgi:transglutaminase-like putative cysteine protease